VQLHTKETTEMPLQLESSDAKLGSSVSDSVLITVDITKFIFLFQIAPAVKYCCLLTNKHISFIHRHDLHCKIYIIIAEA